MRLRATVCLGVIAVGLMGCDGGASSASSDEASWEAPRVSIGLRTVRDDARPLSFEVQDTEYTLDAAVLSVAAVELHLCANARDTFKWINEAHAHVPSSATRLGTPAVDDVFTPSAGARIFGEISPPVGRYCEAHVVLAPADDDVMNLTAISTEVLDGYTAVVAGQRSVDGESEEALWTTDAQRVVMVPLEAFELSEGEHEFVVIEKVVDTTMLERALQEHVAAQQDEADLARLLMDHVADRMQLYEPKLDVEASND